MKRVVKTIMLSSAAVMMLAAAPVWADIKIGVVNFSALEQESPQAKVIMDGLRNEFLPRQRELQNLQASLKAREDKLQKDGATMSDEQRNREDKDIRDGERELQRKQSEAQDDFNARRSEESSNLEKQLVEEVQRYAKAQNYDVVVAAGVLYATPAVDITPAILTALNARAKAAPAAGAPATAPAPKPASK